MKPGALSSVDRIEGHHWWYRGLRDAVRRCLTRPGLAPPPRPRVLDAGCGAGANLAFLGELLDPSYLGGFDLADDALEFSRRKAPPGTDVYRSDLTDPAIHADGLDLVTSFDVLSLVGLERARPGVGRLVEALVPGGLLLLNLPAYRWLWSQHDVVSRACERYNAGEIGRFLTGLGLDVVRMSYRVCLLFPAALLSRLPDIVAARRGGLPEESAARSGFERPSGMSLGGPLLATLQLENALIARGARLPWGTSVFAIGRKPS
jgi:SAM-dependent methyltransferase